jgi:hypothetical protein
MLKKAFAGCSFLEESILALLQPLLPLAASVSAVPATEVIFE